MMCAIIAAYVVSFVVACAMDNIPEETATTYITLLISTLIGGSAYVLYWDVLRDGIKRGKKFLRSLMLSVIVVLATNLLTSALIMHITHNTTSNQMSFKASFNLLPVPILLSTIFLKPITEEVVFRYIIQGTIGTGNMRYSKQFAIVVSGCLFGLFHSGFSIDFFPYFIAGIIFGVIYEKSDNLALVTFAHAVNNALVVGAQFLLMRGN